MEKYDIFISYRREGGYDTAKHLYDLLSRDGYKVSFDIDTLRNGDFDTSLLNRIDESKDFILIIDANAFDRTLDSNFNPKNDWLRQELAYALKKDKNIIPVFLKGVSGFPDNLPIDIRGVVKKNGPEYNRYYFNDFYKALKNRFLLSKPKGRGKYYIIILSIIILVTILYLFSNRPTAMNNSAITTESSYTQNIENVPPTIKTEEKKSDFINISIQLPEPEYGIDTGCFKCDEPYIGYIKSYKEADEEGYIRIYVESLKNSALVTEFFIDGSELSQVDKSWLPSLLKEGNKVKIDYHSAGNAFLFINSIETIK